jgi:thiol-disulfide isomerase/thioredoxin
LLSLTVGLALAAILWFALTAVSTAGPTKAPPFSLPRLGGGPPVGLPLTGAARHVPVVLTFFASWCGPCHDELPTVAQVAARAGAGGERVRFVGVDGNDDPSSGLAFARSSGVMFPVATDRFSQVAPQYSLPGYPGTAFIDAAGNVAGTVRGPVSRRALEEWIHRLST